MTGLKQYVLRYWEIEFSELRPQKNGAGNRIYKEKDVKLTQRIILDKLIHSISAFFKQFILPVQKIQNKTKKYKKCLTIY